MTEGTKPKLVATDLDGTIVRTDGGISARTIAALGKVDRSGATLVFVTGRPPRWIHDVADVVGHRGLAICANGALLYDLTTDAVVRSHLIEPDVLAKAVDRMRTAIPGLAFAVEYPTGFVFEPAYHLGRWDAAEELGGHLVDGTALVSMPGTKLLAYREEGDPHLYAQVEEAVGDLVTVTYSSGSGLIEMSAIGVSKASALAELCAEQGVTPAEVVAFGDMPNDLPMLAWAGQSYAVANAHPDVLAAVKRRAPTNDDDGVARVLEQLFP